MFHISPDQTQWFHLYRVQKTSPIMFVLFCSEEVNEPANRCQFLDLRIISSSQSTVGGGSWCVTNGADPRKQANRSDCTRFLEMRAKFLIASMKMRGVDEVELAESSQEELELAVSLDETLRNYFVAAAPTLAPKTARDLITRLGTNRSGLVFEDIPEWPTRNLEITPLPQPAPSPAAELLTTKTQRVPV